MKTKINTREKIRKMKPLGSHFLKTEKNIKT